MIAIGMGEVTRKMRLFLTLAFLCKLSWGFPRVTVIQFQGSGVAGGDEAVEQVLVNGVPLTSSGGDVKGILRAALLSNDSNESFQQAVGNVNITMPRNYIFLRLRECKLNGFRVMHLTDRILYNGNKYLTLDRDTDTWTAEVPQALQLKRLWDQDTERTRRARMRLQEGCTELMKELTRPEITAGGVSMIAVLVPVLAALAFLGLVIISFFISKQDNGHPGGVLGSIVHYHQTTIEVNHPP